MGLSLAEIALLLAGAYVLYRVLAPLQRRLEWLILKSLDPSAKPVIDVEAFETKPRKPKGD